MDSADSAFQMQYYRMYGIKWGKVKKLEEKDMIDFVQDLLAQGRFYYLDTENNQIFIEQHRKYRWDEDTEKSDKPKVIKKDDHTCDAFKYDVVQNRRDFGLQLVRCLLCCMMFWWYLPSTWLPEYLLVIHLLHVC